MTMSTAFRISKNVEVSQEYESDSSESEEEIEDSSLGDINNLTEYVLNRQLTRKEVLKMSLNN